MNIYQEEWNDQRVFHHGRTHRPALTELFKCQKHHGVFSKMNLLNDKDVGLKTHWGLLASVAAGGAWAEVFKGEI